jgi:hypothetical protein
LDQIKKYSEEKHYIYSSFFWKTGFGGHGIIAISKVLKMNGYKEITIENAANFNKNMAKNTKEKRFVMAVTSQLTGIGKNTMGDHLHGLLNLFNNPLNKNGEYVQLFLASQNFNEGIDFKDLRNIHMFEPLLTQNDETQTIGRGARYCSHANLDYEKEWIVRVHKYIADFPIEYNTINIDNLKEELKVIELNEGKSKKFKQKQKHILQLEKTKDPSFFMIEKNIKEILNEKTKLLNFIIPLIKSTAIDCQLYQNFHNQGGENITCE